MMKIENLVFYDYDINKEGDVIATCTGIRGKFVGEVEYTVKHEKIAYLDTFKKVLVTYEKHGRHYTYSMIVGYGDDDYEDLKKKNPYTVYEETLDEHMIVRTLEYAYNDYKKKR